VPQLRGVEALHPAVGQDQRHGADRLIRRGEIGGDRQQHGAAGRCDLVVVELMLALDGFRPAALPASARRRCRRFTVVRPAAGPGPPGLASEALAPESAPAAKAALARDRLHRLGARRRLLVRWGRSGLRKPRSRCPA
jgi:hypothetical protein